ncbi:MAG: hypothetical protein A07HR60_01855 [uncultured archaeon A07HR60]|nr:MAG: hypothetical protein A07HR60_01855 [uncultured archaeon A07HR60]
MFESATQTTPLTPHADGPGLVVVFAFPRNLADQPAGAPLKLSLSAPRWTAVSATRGNT